MSTPEKEKVHAADMQETYCEEEEKESIDVDIQNKSLNESQDFHLIDSQMDESLEIGVEETKPWEDSKEVCQKQDTQLESQQAVDETYSKIDDRQINISDIEKKVTDNRDAMEAEPVKTVKESVSNDTQVSEKENKLSDNDDDEIIEGTPPRSCSPVRTLVRSEVVSLKRKAGSSDEPPNKILKIAPMEKVASTREQFETDESQELCKSDDSFEEFQKNPAKDVVIEETQDPASEFVQNSVDDLSKECKLDKDENLNVSAKLIETSANDSTIANMNFLHESDVQAEDNNLSIEMNANITISSSVVDDERLDCHTDSTVVLDETDESLKLKSAKAAPGKSEILESPNCVESRKIADTSDKETFADAKMPDEQQPIVKSTNKSRMSVEVIYDRAKGVGYDGKPKPELVEIDEDGEKIVLDSLEEESEVKAIEKNVMDSTASDTIYKSCYESKSSSDFSYKSAESAKESSLDSKPSSKLVNGSSEFKRSDTDATLSVESDTFSNCDVPLVLGKGDGNAADVHSAKKLAAKGGSFASKNLDNIDLISISDNEHDISNVDETAKNKSDLIHNSALAKAIQVEREIGMYVRLKCLLQVDESTKEFLGKELTGVQCEPIMESSSARQKNEDTSSSLADLSDNKETSPGSVNSNPQLYHLNPSRLSIISSISSSSSASSAASLAAKLMLKDSMHFSLPRGPAKHARKLAHDVPTTTGYKQAMDEAYDHLIRDWKNHRLLTTTILNCANVELGTVDAYNVSNERLDEHHLQKMRSSTPEVPREKGIELTPKSTKKGKAMKRSRSKIAKSGAQLNGENKHVGTPHSATENDNGTPSRKRNKTESADEKLLINDTDVLANSSPRDTPVDSLIGKSVFAKWSDNNYYPGTVIDRMKTKYKVNFYDGQNKMLIPEFIIPIPKTLKEGLSVYATTKANDYGSCGIIVDAQTTAANDAVYYRVEIDEGDRLRVQVKDIFLSADQAQVLKEEINSEIDALPVTPKHLGHVTLDNVVDGKRRSKRIGTPVFSTPKSRGAAAVGSASKTEPSVSGMSSKLKREKSALSSENESISSDSNVDAVNDESALIGVQREIVGTPYMQVVKGPQSRIKGKPRSKKKIEDEQTIATLGPIPQSAIFKGMSFILTCASLDMLDKYQDKATASETETEMETDNETENEEDWTERPFVRDRLQEQIVSGGGKFYEDFSLIPRIEYKNTKLITNVPNTTSKSVWCLSTGIPAYNHKWIIRCCLEGKIVNPAENALPTGWSLQKRSYVETFETFGKKPLAEVVVIIPSTISEVQYATFWREICENAGAVVLVVEDLEAMKTMDFENDVVMVSNQRCPSWAIERAIQLQIPILSTTWVIQCLIEGQFCPHDQNVRYKYNYIKS